MEDFKGRHVLVFGLARSGFAAARLLIGAGARVCGADENEGVDIPADLTAMETHLGHFRGEILGDIDTVVVSPGVPDDHPVFAAAAERDIPVIGELELAFRFSNRPVIAVTGTNGKSTTVEMIGEMLREDGLDAVVAGNTGTPFSSVVTCRDDAAGGSEVTGADGKYPSNGNGMVNGKGSSDGNGNSCEDEIFVIEVSSFQLETIERFHPVCAGILNLTPDHLDRYRSLEDYFAAKEKILDNIAPDDHFFYNADDPLCVEVAGRTEALMIPFSVSGRVPRGVYLDGEYLIRERDDGTEEIVCDRGEIKVVGLHNIENALAAIAAVTPFGVAADSCRRALASFRGLPHRMELVAESGGISFYNDSKATNVEGAVKSLRGLTGPVVLIAGGYDKGGDYSRLLEVSGVIRSIVTIGEAAGLIESAVEGRIPFSRASSMEDAVAVAVEAARGAVKGTDADEDWLIVLSPACASFDMFSDFEHRGRVFRGAVASYIESHSGDDAGGGE